MADREMIEEKIGEALGLEKAAQKGVKELESRGLLKPEHYEKIEHHEGTSEQAGAANGGISTRINRI